MAFSQKTKQTFDRLGKVLGNFLKKENTIRDQANKALQTAIKTADEKKADVIRQKINNL